ncbi:MAG: hypothetical protein HQK78_20230 [Desulfobacterales bacterium]|nr:hypothetical protein [Desulfobacterales bacterium]
MLLIRIRCPICDFEFNICRCCFRGQSYCSDVCREIGKREKHRQAQKRFRATEKGKKSHRKAENKRRERLKKKNEKNMDDATSTPLSEWCTLTIIRYLMLLIERSRQNRCHFCGTIGQIVNNFPRKGYGKNKNTVKGGFYD